MLSLVLTFLLAAPHMVDAADTDGDGIDDAIDNCPSVANSVQSDFDSDGIGDACDTCTDVDGDGIGDAGFTNTTCVSNGPDNCQFLANPDQTDTDSDGLGDKCDVCTNGLDIDTDADGICDSLDRCPGFDDATDADGDGRSNGCDNCPLAANNGQIDVDDDGLGDACDTCTDVDGDGVGDAGFTNTTCSVSNGPDNCRFAANPTQTDTDVDSLGDACDPSAGAPVTSVIVGEARNIRKRKTTYFGSSGSRPKATAFESDAQWIMPKAGVLSNLYVRLSKNASIGGASYTFTVRVNGASPAGTPTCTITGATSSCSDTTHSVAFSAGDLLAIQATPSSPEQPTDNLDVRWAASL